MKRNLASKERFELKKRKKIIGKETIVPRENLLLRVIVIASRYNTGLYNGFNNNR